MNSTHAHFNLSAREIGAKLKLHGSACPPFWIFTVEWFWWRHRFQIASFSPSTLENSVFKKHRFQISPLWRAFSNGSVFGDRFRRCSVDDSRIRSKTAPFSFENGLVWTGPQWQSCVNPLVRQFIAGKKKSCPMRPRAAFSRPRSQFFTIRTDPKPANNYNIYISNR